MSDDYRSLLLQFIASLTLADHMSDVADDVEFVLKKLGLDIDWSDWGDLSEKLGEMGVTTLYGTSLVED